MGPFLLYRQTDQEDPLVKYGSRECVPVSKEALPYVGPMEWRRETRKPGFWITQDGLIKCVSEGRLWSRTGETDCQMPGPFDLRPGQTDLAHRQLRYVPPACSS